MRNELNSFPMIYKSVGMRGVSIKSAVLCVKGSDNNVSIFNSKTLFQVYEKNHLMI